MGAPLGLHASAPSSSSAPHSDPPAVPRIRPGTPPPTSTAAPLPQSARAFAAAEDHRGDSRPPRHQGRQAAAPPIDVNARLQHCRRLPPPVLSNAPPRACFPSSLSATPLSARSRLRGRPQGVVGLLRGRSRGSARAAPRLVDFARGRVSPLCFAPSFLCPLAIKRMRIRFGRATLGAPEIVPAGSS